MNGLQANWARHIRQRAAEGNDAARRCAAVGASNFSQCVRYILRRRQHGRYTPGWAQMALDAAESMRQELRALGRITSAREHHAREWISLGHGGWMRANHRSV